MDSSTITIKVEHTVPTKTQWKEYGIERAFPQFYVHLSIYDGDKDNMLLLDVKVEIKGCYMPSEGFHDTNLSVLHAKRTVPTSDLLWSDDVQKELEKSLKDCLYDDHIGIIETMDDEL